MSCDNRGRERARGSQRVFTDIPRAWDQYVPIKFNLSSDGNLLSCPLAELQAMQRKAIEELHDLNKYGPLSLYYIGGDNGL